MNDTLNSKSNTFPTLYLARHGETDFNLKKIFQGRTDNPLNETGLKQAAGSADLLKQVPLTKAFVSPLVRAVTTADIILKDRDIPIKVENRLTEIDFGDWETQPEVRVMEVWSDDYMNYRNDMGSFHPSNGESSVDAQKRAGEWWDEIIVDFTSDDAILVVAHQSLNAILACYVCGIPLKEAWNDFKAKPGEVIRIIPGPIAQVSKLCPEI